MTQLWEDFLNKGFYRRTDQEGTKASKGSGQGFFALFYHITFRSKAIKINMYKTGKSDPMGEIVNKATFERSKINIRSCVQK